jgi:lysophospholipase L1-like esterase
MRVSKLAGLVVVLLLLPALAHAELPWQTDEHTRYMGMGDSLAAGFGAVPATHGYVYLLYQRGVFDTVPNTLFANAAVPGATSRHVLDHQVPQAIEAFHPDFITLTVGGNDLLRILEGESPAQVLAEFGENLTMILSRLRTGLPQAQIAVSNLYSIPEITGSDTIVPLFNQVVEGVAAAFGVPVADVFEAFQGKQGLLLIERHGAGPFQVHPTNAGYRAMAGAFVEAFD